VIDTPNPPPSGSTGGSTAGSPPPGIARVDALLAEFRRLYPDALAVSRGLVERRGESGLD